MVKNDLDKIYNWTSQVFFSKGATMVYAGQERCDSNLPSLFDIDKVNWEGHDISGLIKKLSNITKDKIFSYGNYEIHITDKDVFYAQYKIEDKHIVGIFNLGLDKGELKVSIEDGKYTDIIDNIEIEVIDNTLTLSNSPLLFWVKK